MANDRALQALVIIRLSHASVTGIFGDTVSQPVGTTAANPLRFPGQQFDPNLALHYNYFRDYDTAGSERGDWNAAGADDDRAGCA